MDAVWSSIGCGVPWREQDNAMRGDKKAQQTQRTPYDANVTHGNSENRQEKTPAHDPGP